MSASTRLKYLHTTVVAGTGRSIADPIRPAVADRIRNTPRAVLWSRDMRECVLVMPDAIDPGDAAAIDAEVRAGRARWLPDGEMDQWLRARLRVPLQTLAQRVVQSRFFRHVRGAGHAPRAQGHGDEGSG